MEGSRRARVTAGVLALGVAVATLTVATATNTALAAPAADDTLTSRHDETGKVGYIGTRTGQPIDVGATAADDSGAIATAFLRDRAGQLGLGRGSTLLETRRVAGPGGGTAVRVQQQLGGIPVLGGEFTVNLDRNNAILSVLGEASPTTAVRTQPSVSAARAAAAAKAAIAKSEKVAAESLSTTTPTLNQYDARLLGAPSPFTSARLSWVLRVTGGDRGVTTLDHTVVVDATKGSVALSFSNIEHAKDRIVCDANNTPAEYPCTPALAEWTETSQPAGVDTDVALAFEYAGDTYDFFFSRFGRDSLDGKGMQLRSTTDYCPTTSPDDCPYLNAFWDGAQMVYGDGFASADDVVGHELAHGVTDFSSSLFYYYQSGAINESMSDIFGELIDQVNGSGNDTAAVKWQLGEDVPIFGAIRNMADPTLFGDPDRMLSPFYFSDPQEQDGGGVHLNSGVGNKSAYLMTDGGTFNGQTITGLGITKTARLYYTVNNTMLVSGSDYADLANALRQACTNLATAGTDGITAADCGQVEKVLLATEMDQNPTQAPTGEPTACPAGGAPVDIWYDNLETPAGQFTTGAIVGVNAWWYPQNPNRYEGYDATYATSGETNIWGDDDGGDPDDPDDPTDPVVDATSDSFIRMTNPVSVPAGAYFMFNHAFGFEDGAFYGFDGGVVEYSTTGAGGPWVDAFALFNEGDANGYNGLIHPAFSNPLANRRAFVRESNGYGATRADLSTLAGKSVMFRWRIGTDDVGGDYGWFIDDPRIYTCDATGPDTTITRHPKKHTSDRTPKFRFASNEAGSTFQCWVDDSEPVNCTSPYTTARLRNGKHTFWVAAVDKRGNADSTPAKWKFTVDTKNPKTFIARRPAPRKAAENTVSFRFTSNEKKVTFQCRLDGGTWKKCPEYTEVTVSPGMHELNVRAKDRAGNKDQTPAERKWRLRR